MRAGLTATALALGVLLAGTAVADGTKLLSFDDLNGWARDDHAAALETFRVTCNDMNGSDWAALCAVSATVSDARQFFELFFRPVLVAGDAPALFTGYYEPELEGARRRTGRFAYPVYRRPPEIAAGDVWLTRAEIETSGVLRGRDLEIAWLADPVEAFFLQIQGSGRIRLQDGSVLRLGYGGRNGHPYRSVGAEMARRGLLPPDRLSAGAIRAWVRNNPQAGRRVLHHNPSFIFFRELDGHHPSRGPLGAMNRPVTAMRTIAVDPAHTPLGAPVWIEKDGADPLRRLMVAQDTGGAITGPQRADIFYGTGNAAGQAAGRIRDGGRMIVLLPIDEAFADASEF